MSMKLIRLWSDGNKASAAVRDAPSTVADGRHGQACSGHPLYGSRRRRGGLAGLVGEVFWLAARGLLDVDLYLAVDRRPLDNQCAGVGLGHVPGAS